MSSLDDLQKSVSKMSNEELMLRIKDIRKKRRSPLDTQRGGNLKAVGTNKKVKNTKGDAKKKLEALTPEERAELIKQITGGIR